LLPHRPAIARSPKGKCPEDATTAACPDRPDHQDGQAKMVDQADQELQAHLDSQANHHQKSALLSRLHRANHAHRANPASPDHKVPLATPAQLVTQAMLAKTVNQAVPARKVHLAHPEIQVTMDHEVIQARQLSALQPLPETQDPPDPMDHPAQLVNQAPKATMEIQAVQDLKAHQVHPEVQAKMVLQATKDHPAPMGPKENRVFARNTALWTAVFSSKMEQDVKNEILFDGRHSFFSFLQSRHKIGYGERLFLFAINPFLLSFFYYYFLYFKQYSNVRKVPRIVSKIPFHKKNNAICAQSLNFTVDLFPYFFFFDYLKE
jgi:hypothetical protein